MEEKDKNINEKEVMVILPEEETEEDKKKRKKRIIMLLVMMFVLVADIAGILAYFATMKDYHRGDSDTSYVISEESKSIYQNLLSFVKNACGTDHPKPNQIVAVNYENNKLAVSSKNDTNEIYLTYNHEGGIDDTLSLFKTGVPSLEGYSVESAFYLTNEKELNINNYVVDNQSISLVSKTLTDQYYVSFTYSCSCGSMISMVHQEYDENNNYTNKLSVPKENKILYDLLYVIVTSSPTYRRWGASHSRTLMNSVSMGYPRESLG